MLPIGILLIIHCYCFPQPTTSRAVVPRGSGAVARAGRGAGPIEMQMQPAGPGEQSIIVPKGKAIATVYDSALNFNVWRQNNYTCTLQLWMYV